MKTQLILQDIILNYSRRERKIVEIILVGGNKIMGIVRGFDQHTIIIDEDEKQLMIYKSNVLYVVSNEQILVGETRMI